MHKILWKVVSGLGVFLILLALMANAIIQTRSDIYTQTAVYVGYLVMAGGATMIFFGWYQPRKADIMMDRLPPVHGLARDEQVLEVWRYKVRFGFLRRKDEVAALTNRRIIRGDAKNRMLIQDWDINEVRVIATSRKSSSIFSYSYSHTTYDGPAGMSVSPGFGTGSGVSQVVGCLEIIKNGKVEYVIYNVLDPDGIVQRISSIVQSRA